MKENKQSQCFMAIACGTETKEPVAYKKYIGVGSMFVRAINPSKETLNKLTGREKDEEPEYLFTVKDENGVETKSARIDVIVQTDAATNNEIDFTHTLSFFLRDEARVNSNGDKLQVINLYGSTAWITHEQLKTKTMPDNMSWFDTTGLRAAYVGEEELTMFIKAYLNIPNKSFRKKSGEVVTIKNIADAECQLVNIPALFNGNFTEVQKIANYQPLNKVKVMFGIKTSDDNREYQTAFTSLFVKNNVTNYSKLEEKYLDKKANNGLTTSIFEAVPLKEYTCEATTFNTNPTSTGVPPVAPVAPQVWNTGGQTEKADDLPF